MRPFNQVPEHGGGVSCICGAYAEGRSWEASGSRWGTGAGGLAGLPGTKSRHTELSCLTCAMMSATALSRPARFSRQDCYHVGQLSTRAPRRATGATRTARTVRVRTYMGTWGNAKFEPSCTPRYFTAASSHRRADGRHLHSRSMGLKLKLVRGRSLPHDGLALTSQGLIWLDLT